ncbi:MAG TPA: hypothetical protein VHS81_13740 [Caulobacteraceae bacterium]|nr:hypothetical protein [Caulobacteraceae bacterium]
MTRWFHAAAAALFVLVVWTGLGRDADPPATDPRPQLIELLARSGFAYAGARPLLEGGSALRLRHASCRSDFELVYMPALSRIAPSELARIGGPGATVIFVHDGDVIEGLSPPELMPRWVLRKLLVAVRLRRAEPWQSIALALFVPRNCVSPPIDWRSLTLRPTGAG